MRGYVDRGDGPPCPEPGDHGRTYQVFGFAGKGEYWWCPVTQELFDVTDRGHGIGKALRVKVEVADEYPDLSGMEID